MRVNPATPPGRCIKCGGMTHSNQPYCKRCYYTRDMVRSDEATGLRRKLPGWLDPNRKTAV